jgi:hypothetical protein
MWRKALAFSALVLFGAGLTGCAINRFERREAWRDQAEQMCIARKLVQPTGLCLARQGDRRPRPLRHAAAVRVTRLGGGSVALKQRMTLACPALAEAEAWLADTIQPAANLYFGVPVAEINAGSYSCRGRNNQAGAKLSEHSFGNALDIMSFTLADGHVITVKGGWRGTEAEQAFLREVFVGACARFSTVLAPGSNVFHYDHIHVDLAMHDPRGLKRICKPLLKFESQLNAADGSPRPLASPRPPARRQSRPKRRSTWRRTIPTASRRPPRAPPARGSPAPPRLPGAHGLCRGPGPRPAARAGTGPRRRLRAAVAGRPPRLGRADLLIPWRCARRTPGSVKSGAPAGPSLTWAGGGASSLAIRCPARHASRRASRHGTLNRRIFERHAPEPSPRRPGARPFHGILRAAGARPFRPRGDLAGRGADLPLRRRHSRLPGCRRAGEGLDPVRREGGEVLELVADDRLLRADRAHGLATPTASTSFRAASVRRSPRPRTGYGARSITRYARASASSVRPGASISASTASTATMPTPTPPPAGWPGPEWGTCGTRRVHA